MSKLQLFASKLGRDISLPTRGTRDIHPTRGKLRYFGTNIDGKCFFVRKKKGL